MARKRRVEKKVLSFEEGIAQINERKGFDINNQPDSSATRLKTAIYARLSDEDNGYEESDSIEMQVSYIHRFILDNSKYELVDTYVDNGYSGTNFDRPEFKRMMTDLLGGRINCIVVKDLSRFGKNYLEVGVYIENIFPRLSARLISINDNFDSSREEDRNSLSVPIKNMVNELYARDLSQKIKAANKVRMYDRDVAMRSIPSYGYKVGDNKHFIPDERYAPYVRLIFQWGLIGVTASEIADRLTLIGAPVPGSVTGKSDEDEYGNIWFYSKIQNILSNPVYTGDLVLGRYQVKSIGGDSKETDSSEWVIHKNTHEPLVPRDDYWLIRERKMDYKKNIINKRNKAMKKSNLIPDDYKGLVYCAKCNHLMTFTRFSVDNKNNDYSHVFYRCSPKDYFETNCGLKVSGDFVKMIVNEQLKMHIKLLCDRASVMNKIKYSYNGKDIALSIDKQIQAEQLKYSEIDEKNAKLYEDYSNGLLDAEDYKQLKERTSENEFEIKEKLDALYKKRDEYIRKINRFLSIVDEVKDKNIEDDIDKLEIEYTFDDLTSKIFMRNNEIMMKYYPDETKQLMLDEKHTYINAADKNAEGEEIAVEKNKALLGGYKSTGDE